MGSRRGRHAALTAALVGAAAVNLDSVFNRPPIAQTFRQIATGEKLTITINHFKSKGSPPGSGPDTDQGDGQSAWNVTRTAQANALTAWLATHPTGDSDPDVLIIGDLNAYAKEDPITAIKIHSGTLRNACQCSRNLRRCIQPLIAAIAASSGTMPI